MAIQSRINKVNLNPFQPPHKLNSAESVPEFEVIQPPSSQRQFRRDQMKVRTVAIQTDLDFVESLAEQQAQAAAASKNSPSLRPSEKAMTSSQSKRRSQANQAQYQPVPMTTPVVPHHFSPLLASSCQLMQQMP